LDSPTTGLYTWGCTGTQVTQSGGTVRGCTIHVNPKVSNGHFSASDLHDFVIHELTHCYMFLKLGETEYHLPDWYVEGSASWTMTVLGNGTTTESSFWLTYLNTPTWSMSGRAPCTGRRGWPRTLRCPWPGSRPARAISGGRSGPSDPDHLTRTI
jgi:hypothetical protein